MTQRVACFTGRFQPFHNQHLEVLSALSHSFERIIVGVTNPDLSNLQAHSASAHRHTDGANPFSFEARVEIIENSISGIQKSDLSNVQIDIVPFDLTTPESWQVPADTVFAVESLALGKSASCRCLLTKDLKLSNSPRQTASYLPQTSDFH